jgi:hypothetical protein
MDRGVTNKFNRGEIDPRAFLRDDVEKVTNSCEEMLNFMPQRLGPMQYRPGTLYVGPISASTYLKEWVSSKLPDAVLQFSSTALQLWIIDTLVPSPAGTATLSNQLFASDLSGWTDASGDESTAIWASADGGVAQLTGSDTTAAKIYQTMGGTGVGVQHSVKIHVLEAPVQIKIGESGVDSSDIYSGTLLPGWHSLVFTPESALPTITLSNSKPYRARIGQVAIGDGGTLSLPIPGTIDRLSSIRTTQSADVMFVTTDSTAPFRVERRGSLSWSVTEYRNEDGPIGLVNDTEIQLRSTVLTGNGQLIASDDYFVPEDVGRIYRLTSDKQVRSSTVSSDNNGTLSVRVVGVEDVRKLTITISGTWSGTVTLQRSPDDNSWEDVTDYTSNQAGLVYDDGLDNSVLYYRLYIKDGNLASGTPTMTLNYPSGFIDGIVRAITYTNATTMESQVLSPCGSTDQTLNWYAGEWGGKDGHPSANALYEGRLWLGGHNKIWGSVSDSYSSFTDIDEEEQGNSAPIRRTIGFGPVERVEWLAPSSRLLAGLATDEVSIRSSSFGEVVTNSNCNLKGGSSQGSAPIEPLKIDDSIFFVQRSGVRLFEAAYGADQDSHQAMDLMTLHPRVCNAGIKRIAVSRQPETRIYVVLNDGTMRVHLKDPSEDVVAWSQITTPGGLFKDVCVVPGDTEDFVYVTVTRATGTYLERFAALQDATDHPSDCAVTLSSPGTSITGLSRLEGKFVRVWADGADRGEQRVVSGAITLPGSYSVVNIGLPYVARYKSAKVSRYIDRRVIGIRKRVVDLHLAMLDYWPGSVTVGPSYTELEQMPEVEYIPTDALVTEYDETPFTFNGENEIDPRICIQATGPCTILAMSYGVLTDANQTRNGA